MITAPSANRATQNHRPFLLPVCSLAVLTILMSFHMEALALAS